ncbi:MAG TPA: helix-turn-helix transcriptional regulator [Microthrixaceae bacterium]|nr:helix-turn-helix transcriptional regulator [Microthrixaceae bacterium]
MNSSYVRRLRLARELLELRKESGLTHAELAAKIGQSRAQISRLENGHVVDLDDVIKILEAFGIVDDRWIEIMTIARDASERGWWESNKAMGPRQALSANLEAGAVSIREYQMVFIPGLLQTPEFARARVDAEQALGAGPFSADKSADARLGRQRMLRRPDGPTYHVVLDELAVRRAAVPPEVLRAQLLHMAAAVNGSPKITAQVLPVSAAIDAYGSPRSAFSIYTFADPKDPRVVTVDTVTDDLVLTDETDVRRYEALFDRLRQAAMSPEQSIEVLIELARSMARTS